MLQRIGVVATFPLQGIVANDWGCCHLFCTRVVAKEKEAVYLDVDLALLVLASKAQSSGCASCIAQVTHSMPYGLKVTDVVGKDSRCAVQEAVTTTLLLSYAV